MPRQAIAGDRNTPSRGLCWLCEVRTFTVKKAKYRQTNTFKMEI